MNTTTITNKNETIQIIDQISDSLWSTSINNQINDKDRRDSFELINFLLSLPDDILIDSQASNVLTK